MTSGLVNASFSLPEWQAVKMIFFAPCPLTTELRRTRGELDHIQGSCMTRVLIGLYLYPPAERESVISKQTKLKGTLNILTYGFFWLYLRYSKHFPRVINEVLILPASFSLSPLLCVLE